MAEILLSSFAMSILRKVSSFATGHGIAKITSAWNVQKELSKLETSLRFICGVLLDAESKHTTSTSLKEWLEKLKDAVYDIDDILDDISTEALICRADKRVVTQAKSLLISPFVFSRRIREIREKLDEIAVNRRDFGLRELTLDGQNSSMENNKRQTYSFLYQPDIVGRDLDRDEIVHNILRAADSYALFVLPILGLGGIGKTALAKMVFHDVRVNKKFSKMIWACISDEFDMKKILQDIIEYATGEICKHLNLEYLQIKLVRILQNHNYFLVLDDMWTDNVNKWKDLKHLLSSGAKGSVIIVTTRKSTVASVVGSSKPHKVGALQFQECMQIFTRCAFGEGEEEKFPKLLKIGKSIVDKCAGVPLAVKTLGSLLRTKRREKEWLRVRDDGLWEIKQDEDDILPVLKLSYNALPTDLKPCLSYLSIFPKDYLYYTRCIVMLWMAQGLLHSNSRSEASEDVGYSYINELMGSSFFQDALITFDESMPHCKTHDIVHVHDLARYVLGRDLAIVSCETSEVSETIRHLVWDRKEFLQEQEFPKELTKARKVRTFATSYNHGVMSKSFLEVLLSKFSFLRVLILSEVSIDELPDSVGNLKHLRYLDLTWNRSIRFLPNTLHRLLNLQTLDLFHCDQLLELPRDMDKLMNLRYFSLTSKLKCLPEVGIRGWTSLTSLQLHSCSELTSLTEGIGFLTALQTLWINDCPKLPSLPASMKHLSSLQELYIDNCLELDLMETAEAMEGLRSLRTLQIVGLPKLGHLPESLCSASDTLQYLLIKHCVRLSKLPNCLQDFTSLQRVIIMDCPGCMRSNGDDYNLIRRHVPEVYIEE